MLLTFPQFLTQLRIISTSLIIGLLMMTFIFYFLGGARPHYNFDIFTVIILCFAIVVFYLGFMLRNRKLSELDIIDDLGEKLAEYRATHIMTIALFEGPALMCLVIFFAITQSWLLLLPPLISMYVQFKWLPTQDSIEQQLNLNSQERSRLGSTSPFIPNASRSS